jgi:hypothetical protein
MPKQAVLLIHGIGEQKPMETLRSFLHAVWTTDKSQHRPHPRAAEFWSKPYPLSDNFELRRLTTAENRAGFRTDFFEFYWAHLMGGNKLNHVKVWAATLLFRKPSTVPKQLRLAYWASWILILGGLVAAAWFFKDAKTVPAGASVVLSVLVGPTIVGLLTKYVGDAARYLYAAPPNVQRRHAIRSAGVKVLASLHGRDYDRIIVVGHSLGSVIGYDILYHSWAECAGGRPKADHPSYQALDAMEALTEAIDSNRPSDDTAVHAAQRRYFNELKANGCSWRVSDFITLGSPLAHSAILLARDAVDLNTRILQRELARCPPVLEETQRHNRILKRFSYPADAAQRTPHHAAVFGPTRWTNIYFRNKLLIVGDLIGGPLRRVLGAGIKDVPVNTHLRLGLLTHTLYWSEERGTNSHVEALRAALDLIDANG